MRKLLTFLGTGKYEECHYEIGQNRCFETAYVQEALLHKWDIDQFYVFLTPEARSKHWPILSEKIKKQFPSVEIIEVDIVHTSNADGIWAIFEQILHVFQEKDEIIFDITHSFRYQPMMALLVLHYAKVIHEIQVQGIYYGEYKQGEVTQKIVDLTAFVDLQDWITNMYAFIETGNANILSRWVKNRTAEIRKAERKSTEDIKSIEGFATKWMELTSIFQTNQGPKIQKQAKEVLKSLQALKEADTRPVFRPLQSMYDRIAEPIEKMAHAQNEIETVLYTIKWCMDHDLIQQAYTLMREVVPTAICHKYGLDAKKRENHRKVADAALNEARLLLDGNKMTRTVQHEKLVDMINDLNRYPELLKVINDVTFVRNNINHGGWNPDEIGVAQFRTKLEKSFPILEKELLRFINASQPIHSL